MTVQTETNFNIVGETPVVAFVTKGATNDTFVIPHAGARNITAKLFSGATEEVAYDIIDVNNKGTAYSATTTEIVYDSATANGRPGGGYYIMTDEGEVMYVISDSGYTGTGGTLTVKRGCLGTTAAAAGAGVGDDDHLYVMCTLKLVTATTIGKVIVNYVPLPEDPDTNLLGALKDIGTRYDGAAWS